ncbi:MAG: hypothetical protein EXX96DRAFT_606491 [Benjaminiella poitrasii]|nr:MAG: hypothetical protein EXX96DRAFT_606491 [Benjaminiella poitrasii]
MEVFYHYKPISIKWTYDVYVGRMSVEHPTYTSAEGILPFESDCKRERISFDLLMSKTSCCSSNSTSLSYMKLSMLTRKLARISYALEPMVEGFVEDCCCSLPILLICTCIFSGCIPLLARLNEKAGSSTRRQRRAGPPSPTPTPPSPDTALKTQYIWNTMFDLERVENESLQLGLGIRGIVCDVDCDPEELTNKQTAKLHSFSISNSSYRVRSGMSWLRQKALKRRAESNIQASYDRLLSITICTNEGIMQIHNFVKSWCHRENKGYPFSNREMTQDYIARVVLGRTKVGEDFKQQHREELCLNDDMRQTIVAYSYASVRDTYKENTPIPVKQVQGAIAEKAIVIPTDEFRISVTCCHCHQ